MKRLLAFLLLIPSLCFGQGTYTVSRSLIASNGSQNAGFTKPPYTFLMNGSIVVGLTVNIPTNAPTLLYAGGMTDIFAGSFICFNNSSSQVVTVFLDSGGAHTQAVLQPLRGASIDGAPSTLYAISSTNLYATCTNATAGCSNAVASFSYTFCEP